MLHFTAPPRLLTDPFAAVSTCRGAAAGCVAANQGADCRVKHIPPLNEHLRCKLQLDGAPAHRAGQRTIPRLPGGGIDRVVVPLQQCTATSEEPAVGTHTCPPVHRSCVLWLPPRLLLSAGPKQGHAIMSANCMPACFQPCSTGPSTKVLLSSRCG